jgi:class 3 adenylate cyclase/CheY-like chemotaxis protein
MAARLKVFILDDDGTWRAALSRWLHDWSYEPISCSTDDDWRGAIRAENPDFVLVDPGASESGVLRELLETAEPADIPVIVISDASIAEESLEQGAADFIVKPCPPALICAHLQTQRKILEARVLLVQINAELEKRVVDRTQELANLNELFLQFVPRQFQERIRATLKVEPGIYDSADVTVLFLDVRGFTGLAERLGAERSVKILGGLFQNLVPMISAHSGYIDNFGGDSFMAVFEGAESARNAAQAAIRIQQWIFSRMIPGGDKDLENLRVGIGVNTGPVVYAAIGSQERMASTVMGDQVNLSSRIEKLTKAFHSQVLISATTYSQLDPFIRETGCRLVDNLRVRGRSHPIEVYELFSGDPEPILRKKIQIRAPFLSALEAYSERKFDDALELFRLCLRIYPQDAVSVEYVRRCRYFLKAMPEAGFFQRGVDEGQAFIDPAVRRRFPRYGLGSEMDLEFLHNDPLHCESRIRSRGRILDVSTEGMMIESAHVPVIGSVFSLRTSFRGTPLEQELGVQVREFVCQVRWTGRPGGRMGISFVQLSRDEENALMSALESACREGRILLQP